MLIADVSIKHYLLGWLLGFTSLFIILLILVQRGRGGGLAGALGGLGGQSAFGTKAGDNFTKITIIAASVWIVLGILALKVLPTNRFSSVRAAPIPPAAAGKDPTAEPASKGTDASTDSPSPEATPAPSTTPSNTESAPATGEAPVTAPEGGTSDAAPPSGS